VSKQCEVEQVLGQHLSRLQICLQRASGASSGPEEGSDAWLLLKALVDESEHTAELRARFERSGRWLAEQGGRLDARLEAMQVYCEALGEELGLILADQPSLLVQALHRLYRLQAECSLALTHGYQEMMSQLLESQRRSLERIGHRLLALQRINGINNSSMDLDQTLEMTARMVAEELQVALCAIFFYDELQRILTLRATNGPRPLGGMHFTLRLGEGYSGWVADQGHPLLVRDVMTNPHFAAEASTYDTTYHGLMALPIIFFGTVEHLIGVISVQSEEPRDFTPDEMNFLEVVAGIIAINIENGRLYEQTDEQLRRKVHELATIHRVTTVIARTLNLDEVLQMITTQAVHLSGAERSCIFELDAETQTLHILAHYGLGGSQIQHARVKVGECCAGRAVQTGRPIMLVDCFRQDEKCFLRADPLISAEIHSVLCVPLEVKRKVLGCICIYSSHRHLLSPEQMQLVVTFANEAAIAIENARLYEETRRGLELKSMLLRELHHRVKNNLATVAGILSLQRRRTRSPEVGNTLAESVNRVQGLAATHDLLAHEELSEARVDDIARKIVGVANANLSPPDAHITFKVEPCPIVIPSRAVTILALVLNEMVSNAIKHGMADVSEGAVLVRGREEQGMVVVEVIDTGRGPQKPLEEESSEGLGLSLIRNLIADLRGQFSLRWVTELEPPAHTPGLKPIWGGYTLAQVRFPLMRSLAETGRS
jgi:two-component sensor histidine kinase/putative methionine-R-sulfoxide reductase with GAF domain